MNVDRARALVQQVRDSAGDPEGAHGLEDGLWSEVLASIALGNPNAKELAAIALETQDVEFSRWYA